MTYIIFQQPSYNEFLSYRNRLTSAGSTSYTYDEEDNRISSTVGGVTTNYVYDTTGSLSRMLKSTDSTGKTVYYIYGMGLIGSEDSSGNYNNYHYDYRGSTTAITNSSGAVTDRYSYGTYGELLSHTGSSTTPFLYNGRDGVMKDSNGLYYMRSRYYSPELKRFINADVLKGAISSSETLNQYAYANGNPVSMVDPFGTSAEPGGSTAATVGHTVLDIAGMVPVIGIPADIVSTVWYSAEGDWTNAGLSAVGMIPIIGDVGEAGKLGIKGVKLADKVSDGEKVAKGVSNASNNKIFISGKTEWTATRPRGTQQTYEIYQRNDIDWDMTRISGDKNFIGKTNAEAASKGLAPQLSDGNFATLHHIGQDSRGALAEASTRYHGVGKYGQDILHSQYGRSTPNPNFPIDRKKFGVDTREYWKWRVDDK